VIYSLAELRALRARGRQGGHRPDDPEAPNWECRSCRHRWPDPVRLRVAREVVAFYERAKADLAAS
jgi:hypothetical protein